ncbi:hypothetical protein FDI24_gp252 [Acidovorax phage ACP17]|uniref:Uncharacterized protein n=1 Tax=Acidovorax phage ACP17 TaxID=2010329 RepID=A0A218M3A6_9CAUD|nr:hypothetical protein FDI24_gp252 [Acidovorax phage ACP17]ASD50533.1 hypothetical protein [Acidovorax phage ACP17]
MNTANIQSVDAFALNLQLAQAVGGQKAQIHVITGKHGNRVRLLTPKGKWRMVNFHNPTFSRQLEKALDCKIDEDNGTFRAKLPNARVGVKADNRRLAVALAALKVPSPKGLAIAH